MRNECVAAVSSCRARIAAPHSTMFNCLWSECFWVVTTWHGVAHGTVDMQRTRATIPATNTHQFWLPKRAPHLVTELGTVFSSQKRNQFWYRNGNQIWFRKRELMSRNIGPGHHVRFSVLNSGTKSGSENGTKSGSKTRNRFWSPF